MAGSANHIGLDFGTSRTKVCVQSTSGQITNHVFSSFDGPDGSPHFFLPSCVSISSDGSVSYGFDAEQTTGSTHRYFKMATARSKEPSLVSSAEDLTDAELFEHDSPAFLSVIYLTYVLLWTKSQIQAEQKSEGGMSGFLSRFAKQEIPDAKFTVQMGIPTPFSTGEGQQRPFQEILLVSHHLCELAGSITNYREWDIRKLKEEVRDICAHLPMSQARSLDSLLQEASLSTLPESAAGLAALIQNDQLPTGHYAAMDIGAGSTDVSFFFVDKQSDTLAHYIASDSLYVAANTVYQEYARVGRLQYEKMSPEHFRELRDAEREIRMLLEAGPREALQNSEYRRAICAVTDDLYTSMLKVFSGSVYKYFDRGDGVKNRAMEEFENQPCLVFGGGARLPVPRRNQPVVFSTNGVPLSQASDRLVKAMERQPITEYVRDRQPNIRPQETTLGRNASLLAVAYGLSFPYRKATSSWNKGESKARVKLQKKGHSRNEGKYVYECVPESKS